MAEHAASPKDGSIGRLEDFRLRSPHEIRALLQRLAATRSLLHLSTPEGASYSTLLLRLDPERNVAVFDAEPRSPLLQRLLASREISAVGYMDSIKLQFELSGVMLVNGATASQLHARVPQEMYRFQRRESFRVRPSVKDAPLACFAQPGRPEVELALPILDVSAGGCALFLADGAPPIAPGQKLPGVQVELDAHTRFACTLLLHHVTAMNPVAGGVRLGCEWIGLEAAATRALQRFVDQTQKLRRSLG